MFDINLSWQNYKAYNNFMYRCQSSMHLILVYVALTLFTHLNVYMWVYDELCEYDFFFIF